MRKEIATDDKKNYKRNRIRMFFLEAAKEIILAEGVEGVSARKVADLAGYSYATIYNYFEDLNELLWGVRSIMIKDIGEYMLQRINEPLYDLEGIKRLFRIYITYYFENPNVFKFFYFHKLIKPKDGNVDANAEMNFDEIWSQTLSGFVKDGTLQQKDIEVISKIFIYSMHGMIAISFSYNEDLSEEKVNEDLEQIIEYLLNRR